MKKIQTFTDLRAVAIISKPLKFGEKTQTLCFVINNYAKL